MAADAIRAIDITDIAHAIGANALAVFGGALTVLLLVVALVWLGRQRLSARRTQTALVLGLMVIILASLLFATLPNALLGDRMLAQADRALTEAIRQSVPISTLRVFAAITVLANTPVQWAIAVAGAVVLLWRRRFFLATFWIVAIAGNGILTRALKATFERARPTYDHELFAVHGWSLPSGHASGAVAVYGALAYVMIRLTPNAWHLPLVLVAAAIAFATGCSRIFLQVHYASDVLAGFASGAAWLAICLLAVQLAELRHRRTGGHASNGMPATGP